MDAQKQSEWFFASSDMYQVLGYFMGQTTPELAKAIYEGTLSCDVKSILEELSFTEEEADKLLTGFEKARKNTTSATELFHSVRRDYTHLFSNPTFSALTLFESRMSGPDKEAKGNQVYFGRTIPSARAIYERVGFESSIRPKLREDHAAVEFELMQTLRKNQGIALREGDAAAFEDISQSIADFARNHLQRWTVDFFNDVEKNAHEEIYSAVGLIGAKFMQKELAA
ncbi:MAG: molecular chaperone TorD family protein [Raoultibacter sp.]